jgi:hypothetical protein
MVKHVQQDGTQLSYNVKQVPFVLRINLYKIHINKELKLQDKTSCIHFCIEFLNYVDNDEGVSDVLIISKEAKFHLPGCINKQNFRYFSHNNPLQIHKKPLQ